jgi:NADPH:quinone reductase-like Zn-dependent oxidoreductase
VGEGGRVAAATTRDYSPTVRAAVRSRYGGPGVVQVIDVPAPAVKDDELLVRVHATTVNRTDCAARAADPFFWRFFTGLHRPKVWILGTEFAGEVASVGATVTEFAVGDRVFGFSDETFGAHAEYLSIAEGATLAKIPRGMTYVEAAPGLEGSHYALTMIRAADVQSGQPVLVHGATGAIGSAAVQLLKAHGAEVTAVCDTANIDIVKGLGADRVVDYTSEDFTKDGEQYAVVIDAVGKSTFSACKPLLKRRGVYISSDLGPFWQNVFLPAVTAVSRGRRVKFPIPKNDATTAEYLRELMAADEFRPVVDRCYDLEEIVEAYEYVETGQKVGNVVIRVNHSGSPEPMA